eukprot:UN18692
MLKVIEIDRSHDGANLILGKVAFNQDDHQRAKNHFANVLLAHPTCRETKRLLKGILVKEGKIYEKKRDLGNAIKSYEHALKLDPDSQTIRESVKKLRAHQSDRMCCFL